MHVCLVQDEREMVLMFSLIYTQQAGKDIHVFSSLIFHKSICQGYQSVANWVQISNYVDMNRSTCIDQQHKIYIFYYINEQICNCTHAGSTIYTTMLVVYECSIRVFHNKINVS